MSRLESIASLPKLATATVATATSALASGAAKVSGVPDVHWGQVLVWICTAAAGLGTLGLAAVRGYIELSKHIHARRRAAKYRARALAAKEAAKRLP